MPLINPALPSDGDDITQTSNNTPLQAILALLNGNLDSDNIKNGSITGVKLAPASVGVSNLDATVLGAFLPLGIVLEWHSDGSAAPNGFQVADGGLITDARSPRVGKHVANKVNYFARGVANQNILDNPVYGGEDNHTLSQNEMPNHGHGVNDPGHGHGVNDPGHGHGVNDPGHSHLYNITSNIAANGTVRGAQGVSNNLSTAGSTTGISINGSGTGISIYGNGTGIGIANTGGGAAHNNIPAYVGMVYIEKIF